VKPDRLLALAAILTACPAPDETETDVVDTDPTPEGCPFDEAEGPESAVAVSPDSPVTGHLCPVGDQDWATLDHPGGLLRVGLSIEGTVSPVEPTWTVWDAGAETVLAGPQADEAATAGAPLSLWHAVPAGPVLIQVRDQANDGEDVRRPYTLEVETRPQPDTHEPNDETPVALPPDRVTGSIASRGDEDRFFVDAEARQLLRLRLQVPAGGYDPALTLVDGDGVELLSLENPSGRREATDLQWVLAIEEATRVTLTIADDDDREHDPDTAWTLDWSLDDDPDVAEPNDHPDRAVALDGGACGGGWDPAGDHSGFLATTGDVDWLEVPLDCDRGILEAELTFDEGVSPLPVEVTPTLRVVREVAGQTCAIDQDCVQLDATCRNSLDCEGLGNTCLGSGQCAGAAVCLPTGTCGANLLVERAVDDPASLRLSAPLQGEDRVWLAVQEQGGDGLAPDTPYGLTVRTRAEPDAFEPNHVYTAGPPTGANANRHTDRAVEIPVRDCRPPLMDDPDTGDTDMGDTDAGDTDTDVPEPRIPDCCDSPDKFVRGHISHAYDQDWFRYAHPCPGDDCMVRIHVQHDSGPVDVFAQVFRRNNLWFDSILETTDRVDQPARDVRYGGLEETDQCFYAFRGHRGDPYWYHIAIRDTVFRGDSDPTGGTWDWDPEQEYRICVEVLEDGCFEPPCQQFDDGCGTP
jgi:hypothetical protein